MSETNLAYRCACCGAVIHSTITEERIRRPYRMPCIECGKSTLEIHSDASHKIHILVPCLFCPHPHPYTLSEDYFFSKDILTLPCSFAGLDICFIGTDRDSIEDEIDRTESQIMDLTADTSDDEDAVRAADMLVADTNVVREVLFALDQLTLSHGIKCGKCGSEAVTVLIDYDTVRLRCKVCAKECALPARTSLDASDIIERDSIVL